MTALTEPISLPDASFASITLTARNVVSRTRSPFTLATQVHEHQGQLWRAEVDLPLKARADAEAWLAILADIGSGALRFHLGDPAGASPEGSWGGAPVVNGASQTGQTLTCDGFTVSTTGIVKAGDYFQLGSGVNQRLYKVVEDADSDGSGNVTLKFWPRLRESPSDNESIITNDTKGTFELLEDLSWSWQAPSLTRISFIAAEAI